MFSIFAFLVILLNLLPTGGTQALKPVNPQIVNSVANWQLEDFPTPTGIEEAVYKIAEAQDRSNENLTHFPGYAIDPQPEQGNDMNQPVAHNVVIKDSSPSPTPSPSFSNPEPTNRPIPEISQPQIPPKEHSESGCPPCGGGNGKFECVQVVCPL